MSASATANTANTSRDVLVDIQGVRKRYGDHEVLKGIDLQVGRGEVVVLLGLSLIHI